jgi:hypothetical protein
VAQGGAVFNPAVLIRLTYRDVSELQAVLERGMEREITVVHLGDYTRRVAAKALLL